MGRGTPEQSTKVPIGCVWLACVHCWCVKQLELHSALRPLLAVYINVFKCPWSLNMLPFALEAKTSDSSQGYNQIQLCKEAADDTCS